MSGSGGYAAIGGSGPTKADLEDLALAAHALDTAASRLDDTAGALLAAHARAATEVVEHGAEARATLSAVEAALDGGYSPARLSQELRDLAERLRQVVTGYDEAESWVQGLLRTATEFMGAALGSAVGSALGAVGLPSAVGALAVPGTAVGAAAARALVVGRFGQDPAAVLAALEGVGGDGRAEIAVAGLAQYLAQLGKPLGLPDRDAVRLLAAELVRMLPAAGPTIVLTRADPPQLDAPGDAAGLLRNVASTYGPGVRGSLPGTPDGAISVQRLTHPDGTVTWAVEVPGTEAWGVNADAPTDLTTNLRLLAGLPDDMSTAVVEAMRQAGIPPDEDVVLAGHSQGGMVAANVAALTVGLFSVRAVVTAGSPDIPAAVPRGVAVMRLRHEEDVVPQLDGTPDEPGPDTVVITRDLSATGAPAALGPVAAHDVLTYAETASEASRELGVDPGVRQVEDVVAGVLGPVGTTAETFQFQATRDPGVVLTDPATGLPRPPVMRPSLGP